MNDNMTLWNKVCTTKEGTAKWVDTRGGFWSINAQEQRKAATELWGPYWVRWGLKNLVWEFLYTNAGIVGINLDCLFFWAGEDGQVHSFEIGSDIDYRPSGECKKKLQTDVLTKALSYLGFNSDIFCGKFDNRYEDTAEEKAQSFEDVIDRLLERASDAVPDYSDWAKLHIEEFDIEVVDSVDLKTKAEQVDYYDRLLALIERVESD